MMIKEDSKGRKFEISVEDDFLRIEELENIQQEYGSTRILKASLPELRFTLKVDNSEIISEIQKLYDPDENLLDCIDNFCRKQDIHMVVKNNSY